MPYLRAPYYRRSQSRLDSISGPADTTPGGDIITDALDSNLASSAVGSLQVYYVDETPSNVTVYAETPVSLTTDGTMFVSWTDRTGGQRHHRLSFRERFSASSLSWFLSSQYEPSRTTGEITGLVQAAGYDVCVQSIDTLDGFLSQRTYVIHNLSSA